ncbi:unnamed protein product, partial [Coccothraustes coccothraustes]
SEFCAEVPAGSFGASRNKSLLPGWCPHRYSSRCHTSCCRSKPFMVHPGHLV